MRQWKYFQASCFFQERSIWDKNMACKEEHAMLQESLYNILLTGWFQIYFLRNWYVDLCLFPSLWSRAFWNLS